MADADDKKPQGGHSLNDHLYGENIVHEHDEYSDHDHDHFEFDEDGPRSSTRPTRRQTCIRTRSTPAP